MKRFVPDLKCRMALVFFLTVLLVVLVATPVFACEITITPSQASGKVGDVLTFTIDVKKTHRTCITPIEDTEITLNGMNMVSQTLWKQISSDTNRKEITVKLITPGTGKITVVRECTKGGDTCTVEVNISAASVPAAVNPLPAPTVSTPPASPPSPAPAPPAPSSVTPVAGPTWGQAFAQAISQPYIIAHIVLAILATVFLMRKLRRLRYLILLASMSYLGFLVGGCPCALGSLQNIILHATQVKVYLAQYLLLAIPLITAIFWGRVFCGWICPMGAVQQLLYRKQLAVKVSPRIADILRWGKYVVLVGMVIAVIITQTTVFSKIDPFKALFNIELAPVPTTILGVILLASLFIFSPWCRFICPLGAFLSLFSRFSLYRIKVGEGCKTCKACYNQYCDYGAIVGEDNKPALRSFECTRCGECIARCPTGAIVYERQGRGETVV